jgi:hypothetical protein
MTLTVKNPDAPKLPWGNSVSIDLYNCDSNTTTDLSKIIEFIILLCDLLKTKRLGDCQISTFKENDKVTYSIAQLSEAVSITGHFTNNVIYLDIFSHKLFIPDQISYFAKKFFLAEEVKINYLKRI